MKRLSNIESRLGQCYILSYKFATSHNDYELVHGYITQKSTGKMIDHAWVEKEDIVYDPVMDWEVPTVVYYGLFDAEVDKRYTKEEIYKHAAESGTYGPWHQVKPINWWPE